jgi:hypothetical protein
MRIRRAIIIPAVLALGVAGSLLSGAALPTAAGHPASVHIQAAAKAAPHMVYHG